MTLQITNLGEDIIVDILEYLTPEQIFKFLTLNKALYEIYISSNTIYQLLYNKKFTNNENNYTLSLKDQINWKQLFQLRCNKNQKIFTWGENNGGRLGYLSSSIDASHVSKKLGGWSVHTPTNIPEFNNRIVVDLKANGYSFIILLNNGELWFTGMDWKRPQQGLATPGPIREKDYKPNPGTLALLNMDRNNNLENQMNENPGNGRHNNRPIVPVHHNGRFGVLPIPLMWRRYSDSDSDEERNNNQMTSSSSPSSSSSSSQPNSEASGSRPNLQPATSSLNHPTSNIQETNFLSRLFLPPEVSTAATAVESINSLDPRKVVSIGTGREHIIALDNHGNIYSWDSGCSSNIGIKIKFRGIPSKAVINKIAAGWNLSACLIEDIGLLVWYTRKATTREQFESRNFECEASYLIIPFTKNDVADFTVGADYVLYIKKSNSKLFQFRLNAHEFASRDEEAATVSPEELKQKIYPMTNFNNWLSQQTQNVQFTRLNSCFTNFVVFTNHDHVLIGNNDHLLFATDDDDDDDGDESSAAAAASSSGASPVILPELQGQNIKSVEIGDYHYLALTNEGGILSWGIESRSCGCLGIGARELAIEQNPTNCLPKGNNLEVILPMKVKDPYQNRLREDRGEQNGKWVSIAASGWHSGGIYVPNDE
ncbi:hypothetical protein KGF56_004149 [Candida oxycetoniae]|uniref:F-box domain-containing protein n=1 Tax=Candida oxycetoniae TaxID=497107 RepID=A0AAI9SV58_9ASCO|nr:uncharacterized protein KGF56_004149 [Candida oxycetoniae]KAI3403089.1 hypothetical protein KGF56_004149 [Candida oxycetoniae]